MFIHYSSEICAAQVIKFAGKYYQHNVERILKINAQVQIFMPKLFNRPLFLHNFLFRSNYLSSGKNKCK